MSDAEEQDSILDNLSKTRELWSSKAEIGAPAVPQSPLSPTTYKASKPLPNGNVPVPSDVVRAEDQVEEEFELPDIKSMKSQWENPESKSTIYVPLPSAKSPASIAREKSLKREQSAPRPEPVNREEAVDESYAIELSKLKAQFESAAKAASKSRPKSPKAPTHNTAIKDQVTKNTSYKYNRARNTNKEPRFEDEMTAVPEKQQTDQRTETEHLSVNLSSIKTQFESRKDEHLVTPELSIKRSHRERSSTVRSIAYPSDTIQGQESTSTGETANADMKASAKAEPVKSSERVYDEMIGEESVKDRLKRYRSLTESSVQSARITTPPRRLSIKRAKSPVDKSEGGTAAVEHKSAAAEDKKDPVVVVVASSEGETPDYIPSVNWRLTRALFENPDLKLHQPLTRKRTDSNRVSVDPVFNSRTREGRGSTSSLRSRSSSSHSSASSRSKSPSSRLQLDSTSDVGKVKMDSVVRPSPAGTKEAPDYVPSIKVSSMKNMWEQPKTTTSHKSPEPPKRHVKSAEWATVRDEEGSEKVVQEGYYEDRGGIVRPPSAGTKEKPAYNLSSDFLKSRAAMFDSPKQQEYVPRNTIIVENVNIPTEIVNAQSDSSDLNYELSQNLKDTKKMFENGTPVTPEKPAAQKRTEVVHTPVGEVVRPPPAGTRDESDIIPASNIRSARKRFESQPEEVEVTRKEPIDIRKEASEVQQREEALVYKTVDARVQDQDAEKEVDQPEEAQEEDNKSSDQQAPEEQDTEENAKEQEIPEEVQEEDEEASVKSESETEGEYVIDNQDVGQEVEQPQQGSPPPMEADHNVGSPHDGMIEKHQASTMQAKENGLHHDEEEERVPGMSESESDVDSQTDVDSDDDFDTPHFVYDYSNSEDDLTEATSPRKRLLLPDSSEQKSTGNLNRNVFNLRP